MEQHKMVLAKIHSNGMQEWACPACGRRFLMNLSPNYEQTILEEGNEQITHHCSTIEVADQGSHLVVSTPDDGPMNAASQTEFGVSLELETHYLEPFVRWLSNRNNGSL